MNSSQQLFNSASNNLTSQQLNSRSVIPTSNQFNSSVCPPQFNPQQSPRQDQQSLNAQMQRPSQQVEQARTSYQMESSRLGNPMELPRPSHSIAAPMVSRFDQPDLRLDPFTDRGASLRFEAKNPSIGLRADPAGAGARFEPQAARFDSADSRGMAKPTEKGFLGSTNISNLLESLMASGGIHNTLRYYILHCKMLEAFKIFRVQWGI